ncbi:hypothetical protein T10_13232 [Trichinella papuae]|uniref:Uncharacterized protein n=1 Tax=Trichinella papuae TaxID=268474 RepID=A0A0V1M6C7_9BILA|nr:hypothetical protein T10_13232 [Trichinella papuae]
MELYFRAARVSSERMATLVQYHTDAEVQDFMRVWQISNIDDDDEHLKSALFEACRVSTSA